MRGHLPKEPALTTPAPTTTPASVDQVLRLSDGARVVTRTVPTDLGGRRTAALAGQIYVIAGRIDTTTGYFGGYLGQSWDLDGARCGRSLRRWVIDQHRIHPLAMAVVRPTRPYPRDYRLFLEARTLMALSGAGYWMVNNQFAAAAASRRLSRRQIATGQALAAELATVLTQQLFNGRHNTHPAPSGSIREAAVQVVLHADRALDTPEVCAGLRAASVTTTGVTWGYTIRRDLNIRERSTRGVPRVVSTLHHGTRLFWNPSLLGKRAAVGRYDAAHTT
jgi:hypothetical protein